MMHFHRRRMRCLPFERARSEDFCWHDTPNDAKRHFALEHTMYNVQPLWATRKITFTLNQDGVDVFLRRHWILQHRTAQKPIAHSRLVVRAFFVDECGPSCFYDTVVYACNLFISFTSVHPTWRSTRARPFKPCETNGEKTLANDATLQQKLDKHAILSSFI